MPKKYIHKNRGKTLQYQTEDLEKAVKFVKSGAMSIRKTAEMHHVPKVVEDKIVENVKLAAKSGMGVSRNNLLKRTGTHCKKLKIETPMFRKGVPGSAWWEGLKKRYPELAIRKPEKLGTNRARALNAPITTSYFDYLGSLLEELNLKNAPDRIWNADQTGLRFEHNPVKVISEKGVKNVVGKTTDNRTNITIMACGNAAGKSIPPLVIVKGKTSASLHGYNTAAPPLNTKWAFSDKGWMTDVIGEMWFRDLFLPECGPERPQLLIMDGHSSHESLGLLEMAQAENIHILCLPPHCTHYLQPLDRTVFEPFKSYYDQVCSDYLSENSLNSVTKFSFPGLFHQAFELAMTQSNLKNGFKSCGIYPYNSHCLPNDALAPSLPTDRPIQQSDTVPSNSIEAPPAATSTEATQQGNDLNALELLARTSLLVQEQEKQEVQEFTLDDPAQLLDFINQGIIDIIPCDNADNNLLSTTVQSESVVNRNEIDDSTTLKEPLPLATADMTVSSANDTSPADWNVEINSLFLPPTPSHNENQGRKKKNSNHRLLTSPEIIKEKMEAAEMKSKREAEKLLRMNKRKEKNHQSLGRIVVLK